MAESTVLGIGNLSANFKALRADMETRVARAMVVSAGGVLKRRAIAKAQSLGLRRTGALLANIVIKREPQVPTGTAQYHLGVRHGRQISTRKKGEQRIAVRNGRVTRLYANDPYYWRFLEFDTVKRDGTPFIGAALEEGRAEAINAMDRRLQRELRRMQRNT